jgi:hypothetical protein
MPLASLTFHWTGPATAAMKPEGSNVPVIGVALPLRGRARATMPLVDAIATVPLLKITRLVNSPIFVEGVGTLVLASPRGRARPTILVDVGASPSAFDIAQAVWTTQASAVNISGTMGGKVNEAGSAGDPWGTALPGSYAPGTAGYIVGTLLNNKTALIEKLLRNKTTTDPTTGTMTVYDDDGVTVLFEAQVYENVSGSQAYRGQGADRKDRLE